MKVKDKSHFLDYFGLFVLTELLVGKMPITKGKLTRVLGYAGLHIGPKSDGVVSLGRGHQVSWFAASVNVRNWAKYFPPVVLAMTIPQRLPDMADYYILPRLIRLRDAPRYIGMDKNRFNSEVRFLLKEIKIGRQGVAFDRLEIDAWVDHYMSCNGRPGSKKGDELWHSTKEVKPGGLMSLLRTDSEYENLLGLKTRKQQRNTMTG